MLTIRLKAKLTCPKHPKFSPEQGEGAIRGGCVVCFAIQDVWFRLQTLKGMIQKAEAISGAPPSPQPRIGTNAEL
jgi:hypothetical protein